jgi:DNA processing protein
LSFADDLLDPRDGRPASVARLHAWLAFQAAMALRPQRAVRVLRREPDPARALRAAGVVPLPAAALREAAGRLERAGAVALPWGSAAYPARLARLEDAPPLLLVRGDAAALARPAVAVVGPRAPSAYGRAMARRFATELAAAGLVVVSGMATGIDAVAHEAALEAGGLSVAFQACGPDRVYPAHHRRLARRIADQGAVVTEFPPGSSPRPAYFPLRNRLISALSLAVLVVEARERSGSLTTAAHAAEQGVEVYALPGPLVAASSAGTNRLLRDGAGLALTPRDLLEELSRLAGGPPAPAPAAPEGRGAGRCDAATSRGQRRIVAALRQEPLSRDALGRRLGCGPEQLALDLLELELAGRVVEDRDGRLRVVPPAPGPGL